MLLRALRRRERGDEGVALVIAIALVALSAIMMITMVSLTVRENRQSGRDRDRSVSVNYAEGGIDNALAQIQNAAVSSIPCGTTTRTATNAAPETVTITTTVTYFDANGTALTCPISDTTVAAQAQVKSIATSTPAAGGQSVKRTMETLVALKPKYANDLDRAIFGDAGVQVSNNFDLYGQTGPDADVYTNGSFSCDHNEHFRGSVYAQGTITLNSSCTIDVNANAKQGFSMNSTQSTVGGDVLVSNGNAAINSGTVGGKVKAVTITPSSYCSANPSKCVTGAGAAPVPPSIPFPQVGTDTSPWLANGYVLANNGAYLDGCDPKNDGMNNPGNWIAANGPTLASPTIVLTHCTLTFAPSTKSVKLANDLSVWASGGIDLEQSLDFASTDATHHYLYFIQPYGSTCGPDPNRLGVYLGNLVTIEPEIAELLYTPCDVHKANQSSTFGQVYAGGTAYIDNKTDATYVPVPIFGAVVVKRVLWYTADILYKRETLG